MTEPIKSGRWVNLELKEFYVDDESKLNEIDTAECCAGTIAYVIATGEIYMLNSEENWIKQ